MSYACNNKLVENRCDKVHADTTCDECGSNVIMCYDTDEDDVVQGTPQKQLMDNVQDISNAQEEPVYEAIEADMELAPEYLKWGLCFDDHLKAITKIQKEQQKICDALRGMDKLITGEKHSVHQGMLPKKRQKVGKGGLAPLWVFIN